MKKMSDVFELPVDHKKLEMYEAGELQGVPYHVAEEHAAHAINHVDALADALEKALEIMQGDGMDVYDFFNELSGTLRAYRGEA